MTPSILKAVGLGSLFRPWLGLQRSALITVSLISVWQFVGILTGVLAYMILQRRVKTYQM